MTDVVTSIIAVITAVATGLMELITGLLVSASEIFWVTSGENAGPTFIGVLVFFAVGIPLVYFAINWVLNLIKKLRVAKGK